MSATILVKEECDHCDGCGWYEGGPTLMTTCEKCNGVGYIEVEREAEANHHWIKGEWAMNPGDRYYTREDTCQLCGCKRGLVKQRKADAGMIATYSRSRQIYGHNNMPRCWGDKL